MPRPPSNGGVSESYGWRTWTTPPRMHNGEDTVGEGNFAPVSGKVLFAGYYGGLGNLVVIQEAGKNVLWLIGHHASLAVSAGQQVSEGQRIGKIGTTGDSTGIHAHTERREGGSASNVQGGTPTNPRLYYTSSAGIPGGSIPGNTTQDKDEDTMKLFHHVFTDGNQAYVVDTEFGAFHVGGDDWAALQKALGGATVVNQYDWDAYSRAKARGNAMKLAAIDATLDDEQAALVALIKAIPSGGGGVGDDEQIDPSALSQQLLTLLGPALTKVVSDDLRSRLAA